MSSIVVPEIQAAEVKGSRRPGRTGIYRNTLFENKTLESGTYKISSPLECFETGLNVNPNANCLGHREWDPNTEKWGTYIWETYAAIKNRRDDFASGLMLYYKQHVKGVKTTQFTVGIIAINRKEWVISDLACQRQALITVALYDTLGPDATEYIINLAEIQIVIASLDNIPKLLAIKDKLPQLKLIISMDTLSTKSDRPGFSKLDLLRSWIGPSGVHITDFKTVEAAGREHPISPAPINPEDIYTINFTSGTTGMPKGVVITNRIAAASAASAAESLFQFSEGRETLLSYLPLAHIYERSNININFLRGGEIGFFHGNVVEILEDIQTIKPTLFLTVPRLLLRIEAAIKNSTLEAPGLRGAISRKAWQDKLLNMQNGGDQFHWLWDRLWSKKINKVLGGRLKLVISGSAPLPKESTQFLRAALACQVVEGWGMTETMASGTVSHPYDRAVGHVGPPLPFTEVCLLDVPEMGYTSNDKPYPRGELLFRAGQRFKEYYKESAKTSETIDAEGWLHTGDVAQIDEAGRVYIIDRVKNIFKLSHGEYVAAERLEAVYQGNLPLLAQIFIHGDSHQSYLVAVAALEPTSFALFASKILSQQLTVADIQGLRRACNDLRVRKAVLELLGKVTVERKLNGFEKIRNVHLAIDPFTIDNGTLTPSFKLKRPQSLKLYRKVIDDLYAETGTAAAPISKL